MTCQITNHWTISGCLAVAMVSAACGSPKPVQSAKKGAANATTLVPPVITAFGDNCATTGVATTVAGIDARMGLAISNMTSSYAVGYFGQAPNLRVNPAEAVLSAPTAGTYSITIVVRNITACEQQQAEGSLSNDCRPNGTPVQNVLGTDISKKVNFVVSATMNDFLQSGTLGQGQDGIVSDVVNNKGLIGFLNKSGLLGALGGGGAGGAMGGISSFIGASDKANQALDQARAQGQLPKGGCPQNPSPGASIGTPSTTPPTNGGAIP
jgi:hypothetical protein